MVQNNGTVTIFRTDGRFLSCPMILSGVTPTINNRRFWVDSPNRHESQQRGEKKRRGCASRHADYSGGAGRISGALAPIHVMPHLQNLTIADRNLQTSISSCYSFS